MLMFETGSYVEKRRRWKNNSFYGEIRHGIGKDSVISVQGAGRVRRPAVCVCLGARRCGAPPNVDLTYTERLLIETRQFNISLFIQTQFFLVIDFTW